MYSNLFGNTLHGITIFEIDGTEYLKNGTWLFHVRKSIINCDSKNLLFL